MSYVKGYIFDHAKIQRLLKIADDDKEKNGKIDDCVIKTLDFIDRDTNPICLGIPLGTNDRRVVIITAEGDDPASAGSWKETEPSYLKKLAEHLFSGPHILERAD